MDLIVESFKYKFSLDGMYLSLIDIFMTCKLSISVKRGTILLSKKEIIMLIEFIEENKDKFRTKMQYECFLDKFVNIKNSLIKNERVSFTFW